MDAHSFRSITRSSAGLVLLVALLTAYCQAYSFSTAERVPVAVSLGWATGTALWWGITAGLTWSLRRPIRALLERNSVDQLAIAAALVFGLFLLSAGLVLAIYQYGYMARIDMTRVPARLFDVAPASALASGLVVAIAGVQNGRRLGNAAIAHGLPERLFLPEDSRLALRKADIDMLKSAGNYCEIHAAGQVHLVRVTLKTLAMRLQGDGFVRVHRSALVRQASIKAFIPSSSSSRVDVRLRCGVDLPVGRSYLQAVRRAVWQ